MSLSGLSKFQIMNFYEIATTLGIDWLDQAIICLA